MTRQRSGVALGVAFASGLLFGIGLLASGMTDPAKVKDFLDLAGAWDPSLALVMGGAVAVATLGFALAEGRRQAWSGAAMAWPDTTRIDAKLIAGGLLFGAGWGLAGFCPGPALVAVAGGAEGWGAALLFCAAMLAGMWAHDAAVGALAARRTVLPAPPAHR